MCTIISHQKTPIKNSKETCQTTDVMQNLETNFINSVFMNMRLLRHLIPPKS